MLNEDACWDAPAHPRTHNGGPPLEEPDRHVPEWGPGGIGSYFDWKRARQRAFAPVSHSIMMRRVKKAEACGVTYEEYMLVLLDTGRYLQPSDTQIIRRILARRQRKAPAASPLW